MSENVSSKVTVQMFVIFFIVKRFQINSLKVSVNLSQAVGHKQ